MSSVSSILRGAKQSLLLFELPTTDYEDSRVFAVIKAYVQPLIDAGLDSFSEQDMKDFCELDDRWDALIKDRFGYDDMEELLFNFDEGFSDQQAEFFNLISEKLETFNLDGDEPS